MKVNFKVLSVNSEDSTAEVLYWADGYTGDDVGPYTVPILPECADMVYDTVKEHIAFFGINIVRKQYDAIMSKTNGALDRYKDLVDVDLSVNIKKNAIHS